MSFYRCVVAALSSVSVALRSSQPWRWRQTKSFSIHALSVNPSLGEESEKAGSGGVMFFTNYLQVLSPELLDVMNRAEQTQQEIDNFDLDHNQTILSMRLATLMSLFLEDEALDVVMAVPDGHGLEAWRRLCNEFQPRTRGHRRALMLSLLIPVHLKNMDFMSAVQKWEHEYRDFRSVGGEPLPEEVRIGVIQQAFAPIVCGAISF